MGKMKSIFYPIQPLTSNEVRTIRKKQLKETDKLIDLFDYIGMLDSDEDDSSIYEEQEER